MWVILQDHVTRFLFEIVSAGLWIPVLELRRLIEWCYNGDGHLKAWSCAGSPRPESSDGERWSAARAASAGPSYNNNPFLTPDMASP